MKSLTEWGLALAVAHNLEVRPGNEGEAGPPRGFSLHVRGLPAGRVFRYDPEGKPQRLITWLPAIEPALSSVAPLMADQGRGFLPSGEVRPYRALRWSGPERADLEQVLLRIIHAMEDLATPELPMNEMV